MPTIKPISELQRNAAALTREAMQTKEPIYLTRNGSAALVLIDAEEFDRREREHHKTYQEFVAMLYKLGEAQFRAGEYDTLEEAALKLHEKWGDDAL